MSVEGGGRDEGSIFQRDGIMNWNDRIWNLREDGCGITIFILEDGLVSWVVERIKSRYIYEGVEEYTDVLVIERSRISDRSL